MPPYEQLYAYLTRKPQTAADILLAAQPGRRSLLPELPWATATLEALVRLGDVSHGEPIFINRWPIPTYLLTDRGERTRQLISVPV